MLGRYYGTTPPSAYFETVARDPEAFRFKLEGAARLDQLQAAAARTFSGQVLLRMDAAARSLGPRSEPLVGTFRFPLLLGQLSDSPPTPAFSQAIVQREFFDGPGSRGQTLTEFYTEMSRGLLQLKGESKPWIQTQLSAAEVTLGSSGLSPSRTGGIGAFLEALVQALDAQGMDWSAYDQTGNGYVDLLTVFHPTQGAECGGEDSRQRIWSHRWNVASATNQRLPNGIRTQTPGPGPGGFIHIMDYTIQPLLSCQSTEAVPRLNEIGVFAHEIGHGFGLPDLYGTGSSQHTGAGSWDLMATGTWGCQSGSPARPCALGAWSRAMLGWANIIELAPDMDHGLLTLPPSLSTGQIFRVPTQDGSGSYLLLENRQAVGIDAQIYEPGLLIWQVEAPFVAARWSTNTVNAISSRLGVRIRTASGRRNLELAGGDAGGGVYGTPGDIHPGCLKNSFAEYLDSSIPCRVQKDFHIATPSSAVGPTGAPLVVTLQEVTASGPSPSSMTFRLSTRWTRVVLEAREGDSPPAAAAFGVQGQPFNSDAGPFLGVPFQTLALSAPSGTELAPGVRVGFEGWRDGIATRHRTVTLGVADTLFVADLGGREVQLQWVPEVVGGAAGASDRAPGSLVSDPPLDDGWVRADRAVQLEARPRPGFRFIDWVGGLVGASNPVTRTFQGPATLGARFEVSFAFTAREEIREVPGATSLQWPLPVTEATPPITWQVTEGILPIGVDLDRFTGVLQGVPIAVGSFPFQVRATDATGLEALATRELRVTLPMLSDTDLVGFWLGTGPPPQGPMRELLDGLGNRDGFYDLGDLRAYLLLRGRP